MHSKHEQFLRTWANAFQQILSYSLTRSIDERDHILIELTCFTAPASSNPTYSIGCRLAHLYPQQYNIECRQAHLQHSTHTLQLQSVVQCAVASKCTDTDPVSSSSSALAARQSKLPIMISSGSWIILSKYLKQFLVIMGSFSQQLVQSSPAHFLTGSHQSYCADMMTALRAQSSSERQYLDYCSI